MSIIHYNRFKRFSYVASLSFSLLIPTLSHAQLLEEVLVTAQKREQNIQDVGISITAFSGEQIQALGLIESTEIAAITPGVHISSSSGGQTRQFTIRGVTQNDFADHTEAPNAVYIDEGYIISPQAQVFALFDLERVEILKGPQGTLFGRNATGGLAHYITRKPSQERDGFINTGFGSFDQVRLEAAAGGGLSDSLSGRVSMLYNKHGAILDNLFPFAQATNPFTGEPIAPSRSGADDLWTDEQLAFRGQLLWEINADAELLVSGFSGDQEASTGPYQSTGTVPVLSNGLHVDSVFALTSNPSNCEAIDAATGGCLPLSFVDGEVPGLNEDSVRPVPGGDLYGYIDPDGDDFDTSSDHAPDDANRYKTHGLTAKLDWDLGGIALTSVSHYMFADKRATLDVDGSPAPLGAFMADSEHESFTQEFRLSGSTERGKWVAGFYYLNAEVDAKQGLGFFEESPLLFPGFPSIESDTFVDLETDSYSIFGQVDYELNEEFTVIAGIRAVLEEKEYNYSNPILLNIDDAFIDADAPVFVTGLEYPSFNDKISDSLWTGKIQLDYRPNDDVLLYAGINRGVKAGSFNAQLNDLVTPALLTSEIPYDEEILLAYEAGFKTSWMDGKTRLNGSFYYYDYTDYQALLFIRSSSFIRNTDATYKGFELELQTTPTDRLSFMLSVAYIDAEVENLAVADGVLRDVEPSFTPDTQIAALVQYQWPNALLGGTITAQLDANYASSAFHNIRNFQSQRMDSYTVANTRLSWLSGNEKWEASLLVSNFTDSRYQTTGFDLSTLCGCTEEAYGKPRWVVATLSYQWQ